MHILLAILGIVGAVFYYVYRARDAAHVATDLVGVAQDVAGAARRFGFRRKANTHPMDSIDDPNIGVATIANAFMELNDLPTQDMRNVLNQSLQSNLNLSATDAEELMVLGKWLQSECGGADPAIARAGRKTAKLAGAKIAPDLMGVIKDVAYAAPNGLSHKQTEALDDLKRIFRL